MRYLLTFLFCFNLPLLALDKAVSSKPIMVHYMPWYASKSVSGQWVGREVVLLTHPLSKDIEETKWLQLQVDLGKYAGTTVSIELKNRATGWSHEAAYWSRIEVTN
jgi:hypothetical protein